ncbi:hypothetical protein B0I35DRAFT_460638 [Stachybotrys elegans]|uniref:Uncharacterized protein n=1 Tax=Stachybotrys elegans TaxID=80388 RepID=A0A8K0SNI4_9HYPO|nr:hypothetical protein B0I35DRAFT_460638 [Stachybotrys elegans]
MANDRAERVPLFDHIRGKGAIDPIWNPLLRRMTMTDLGGFRPMSAYIAYHSELTLLCLVYWVINATVTAGGDSACPWLQPLRTMSVQTLWSQYELDHQCAILSMWDVGKSSSQDSVGLTAHHTSCTPAWIGCLCIPPPTDQNLRSIIQTVGLDDVIVKTCPLN